MCKRIDLINAFYDGYREDIRLSKSRHGQLEYITTMYYIHRMLSPHANILEIGAGTGKYSIALANEGHEVTAIELADNNLRILQDNSIGIKNLTVMQGDALDLSSLRDNAYDLTLILGPLYHLYQKEDISQALREAIRVTKDGGVLITAFLSVHAIMFSSYLNGSFCYGLEKNFTDAYKVKHFTEQLFTGFDVEEFEALFSGMPVEHVATAAADSVLELAEGRNDFRMSDEDFEAFVNYHLYHCEKRELLGCSGHLIYICKKHKTDL